MHVEFRENLHNFNNNVHEKITHVWSAEKEHSHVKRVQSCNTSSNYKLRARCQNLLLLLYYGLEKFCSLWKINSCLLTPNCTRNDVITYTYIQGERGELGDPGPEGSPGSKVRWPLSFVLLIGGDSSGCYEKGNSVKSICNETCQIQ